MEGKNSKAIKRPSRLLMDILDLETILNKSKIFWDFLKVYSHNPDKITRILGYPTYSDKNDQNRPKNYTDIGRIFARHTS